MSWWLTVELLIAAVIVVVACRMRRYWLGGVLVFLLWPLFGWLVPSQDSMMYALPFVLGVPAIIVWRGRALPPEEKSYLAEKYAYLREPSSVGAFIFGVLFIVSLLWMLSSWEIYDLAGGRLTAWFLSRGIGSRPKKRKSARVFSHSPNGISLGSVLTQVGK